MREVNKETFAKEVLESPGITVVDWWGPRCAPCLALVPQLEGLARKYEGRAKFAKVNSAENRRLAIENRIMGLPTIVFYRDGKPVHTLTNEAAKTPAVEEKLAELLNEIEPG